MLRAGVLLQPRPDAARGKEAGGVSCPVWHFYSGDCPFSLWKRTIRDPPFLLLLPPLPGRSCLCRLSFAVLSAPASSLCSSPTPEDSFGPSIAKKGTQKKQAERWGGKGSLKSQPLPGCLPLRGCLRAGWSLSITSPGGAGEPWTKPSSLLLLHSCSPCSIESKPRVPWDGVRGWCKRLMVRMMKDPTCMRQLGKCRGREEEPEP